MNAFMEYRSATNDIHNKGNKSPSCQRTTMPIVFQHKDHCVRFRYMPADFDPLIHDFVLSISRPDLYKKTTSSDQIFLTMARKSIRVKPKPDPEPDNAIPWEQYEALKNYNKSEYNEALNNLGHPHRFTNSGDDHFPPSALPEPPLGNLARSFHPLLVRQNFIFGNYTKKDQDHIWANLRPAIQFAAKFLNTPNALGPYLPLLNPRIKVDASTRRDYIDYTEPMNSTADRVQITKIFRDELSKKVKFFFGIMRSPSDYQLHAVHFLPHEHWQPEDHFYYNGSLQSLQAEEANHRICINIVYAEFLNNQYDNATDLQKLRTSFALGITLIHELSHTFCARHQIFNKDNSYTEPYYSIHDLEREVGSSLEYQYFGAELFPITSAVTGTEWCVEYVSREWSNVTRKTYVNRSLLAAPVPVSWMRDFFTQAFWAKVDAAATKEERQACFKLPRPPKRWVARNTPKAKWKWMHRVHKGSTGDILAEWRVESDKLLQVEMTEEIQEELDEQREEEERKEEEEELRAIAQALKHRTNKSIRRNGKSTAPLKPNTTNARITKNPVSRNPWERK
ncbi:hypothetical protein K504DRAFT_87405 [Pleomassaria siparia CBS 279.74]|uniref:Uncharacterized protein n=1 Tax=Pleomassaria siparia CBS 279.74 TaxID=1314801 RepID=A0A6G1JZC6_9PLEO|nr:hypothetical protein K504DRAFT_87405 [Pleomassaria siparia CBS 279.74]